MTDLFYDMEPIAIQCGVAADRFWSLCYGEVVKEVQAFKENHLRKLREKAEFAYAEANLASYAHHQPKKMPKKEAVFPILVREFGQDTQEHAVKSNQEIPWQVFRDRMMRHSEAIKKTRDKKNK
ncbi:hypothetical protein [Enterococcus sp.]|uniref:hypothetical protein n=1 Tax=Enterococcus sp. TaxID=35783 RepID=UPI0028993C52|nr:hypothetical protein [Enterococcus sp.]